MNKLLQKRWLMVSKKINIFMVCQNVECAYDGATICHGQTTKIFDPNVSTRLCFQRYIADQEKYFYIPNFHNFFLESSNLQTSSDKFLNSIQAIKDPTAMVALLQCNKNSLTEKHVLAAVRFMATIYEKKHYSSTDPDEEVLLQLFRLIQTSIGA